MLNVIHYAKCLYADCRSAECHHGVTWRHRIGPCGIVRIKFIKINEKKFKTKKWKDSKKNGRK